MPVVAQNQYIQILDTHRYYDAFLYSLASYSASSLGLSVTHFKCGPYGPFDTLSIGGTRDGSDVDIFFRPEQLLKSVTQDIRPKNIDIYTKRLAPLAKTPIGHITVLKYSMVLDFVWLGAFSNYFDKYRRIIETKCGTDCTKWPGVWDFARVVRNALAHDGKIKIDNKADGTPGRSVTWQKIVLSPSLNTQRLMYNFLGPADIFALIVEMDSHF